MTGIQKVRIFEFTMGWGALASKSSCGERKIWPGVLKIGILCKGPQDPEITLGIPAKTAIKISQACDKRTVNYWNFQEILGF